MYIDLNLDNYKVVELKSIDPPTDKRWGYSFVYCLRDLKDIYLLFRLSSPRTLNELLEECLSKQLVSESGKPWTRRNLLELVNAWINFGYISSSSGYRIERKAFFTSKLSEPLTEGDKDILKNIFFNYFKFREFHHLFVEGKDSLPLKGLVWYFNLDSKYVNRFLLPKFNLLYCINDKKKNMMRFWDVYTKWGTELEVMEKISLKAFDASFFDDRLRNANIAYIIKAMPADFSILEYINNYVKNSYISIIKLEWELINKYRFSIKDIQNRIIEDCSQSSSNYRMQSTSSNFIKDNYHRYYPIVNNTYVSHLLKI